MIKFLDITKQYLSIKNEIDKAINEVIYQSAFIGGKYVKQFEERFSEYQDVQFCIGVANGTDALEIALESLDLPNDSEIIVPANSFISSSEAVTRSGHKVKFCDCNVNNYTISIEDCKRKITSNTKAIIAVHLYGHPCDMDELLKIKRETGIKIIEDCAQAHGAVYKGRKVGCIGDVGTFSFYPGKNLGAYGDAGAIVTNDEELALRCRMIANHGRIEKYNHEFEGRNSRLDGLQASVLSVKLKHLDRWIEARRNIANLYIEGLADIDIILPVEEDWAKHVYHLFVIRCSQRDELKEYLSMNEIQTGIHYPIALPKLIAYEYIDQGGETMLSNRIDRTLLSLPLGEHLENQEVQFVIDKIYDFINKLS